MDKETYDYMLSQEKEELDELTRQPLLYINHSNLPDDMKDLLESTIKILAEKAYDHKRRYFDVDLQLRRITRICNE